MRRALRGAVGVALAVAAAVPAPKASATFPTLFRRNQQPPVQSVVYEENIVVSEGYRRLEEMKVELALLADIATFPYYLGARAAGGTLELRGYVPNDMVRQRALELARRNTFLTVNDALKIQTSLSTRPPLRPARVLQKEGAELLHRKLGDPAKKMSLGVRPNGVIVVTGPIDSVESRLAVSRLFRQLSGCFGVANELIVQQSLHDGQHVVKVTRDGLMVVPLSALGLQPQIVASPPPPMPMPAKAAPTTAAPTPVAASPSVVLPPPVPVVPQPAKLPEKKSSAPAIPPSTILPPPPATNSLDARKEELRLPTVVTPKPANTPPKVEPEKKCSASDARTAPKLPVKWAQAATSWESQVNKLEPMNASPTPRAPRVSKEEAKLPTPVRTRNPVETPLPTATPLSANKLDARKEESRLPSPVPTKPKPEKTTSASTAPTTPRTTTEEAQLPTPGRPVETKKPQDSQAESQLNKASNKTSPSFAEMQMAPTPAMTWRRPGGEEGSEPNAQPTSKPTAVVSSDTAKPKPARPSTPVTLSSPRRWPPAYAPENKGRPGLIVFDDEGRPGLIVFDDDPRSVSAPAAHGAPAPIVAANLQRQVQSICGAKARVVTVQTQPDGSVLVKVKVPNRSVEDQLTRKILVLPEMTAPKVRLLMDVGP
jgi:hypothetical protein